MDLLTNLLIVDAIYKNTCTGHWLWAKDKGQTLCAQRLGLERTKNLGSLYIIIIIIIIMQSVDQFKGPLMKYPP